MWASLGGAWGSLWEFRGEGEFGVRGSLRGGNFGEGKFGVSLGGRGSLRRGGGGWE